MTASGAAATADGRNPEVESALRRLVDRAEHPRALTVRPERRAATRQAADRVAAQLLGEGDAVLTIALAGCTGAGKSTLINALAGATIAEAAEQRPCTMRTRVYHHRDVPAGGLPPELASQATFVPHDRAELWHKVLVDTPDLDTFATENRAATRALLKAAGMVIYVFSPEKYWEERAWSVIREEQRFSACLAVLNKADTVPASELEKASEEIRRRFAELGHPGIRVLPVHASRHVPRADGTLSPPLPGVLDEFVSLRAYIEHELQEGDIARMLRQQRLRVLEHLKEEVDRLAPADLTERLDGIARAADARAADAAGRLDAELADRLAAVEAELRPLATIRRHQRFFGPFRLWLAVGDFVTYGLPRLVRRIRLVGGPGGSTDVEAMLSAGKDEFADDLLRGEARRLQAALFSAGLPVERWASLTGGASGHKLLAALAREVEARFEALAAAKSGRRGFVIWLASLVGSVIPMGLAAYALYALLKNLSAAQHQGGFEMLGVVVALTVLSYVLLHGLVGMALAPLGRNSMSGLGRQATQEVLRRSFRGWVSAYREEIEADLADLREPLDTLRAALEAPRLAAISAPVRTPSVSPAPAAPAPPPAAPAIAPAPGEPPAPAPELARPASTPVPRPEPVPAPVPRPEPVVTRQPLREPEPVPEPAAPSLSPAEALRQAMRRPAKKP
jgi:GTP-binding protein EngB required for normal cell division